MELKTEACIMDDIDVRMKKHSEVRDGTCFLMRESDEGMNIEVLDDRIIITSHLVFFVLTKVQE